MTARQIIQEIQALPPEEQREVLLHLKEKSAEYSRSAPAIRYVSKEEAKLVSEGIFDEYADLFRKLAQ